MTRNNLTPIETDDQPTSHVRVGESKVGAATEFVELTHRNRSAVFRVETEDDAIMSDIGNKVYLHENVGDIFGGVNLAEDNTFYVDSDVSRAAIPACESATIHPDDVDPDQLESILRSEEYLLHRIREVAMVGGSRTAFTVSEMSPSAYSTLRVTEDTDLQFESEAAEPRPAAGGSRVGGATGGGSNGGDGEEDGATVTIEPTVPEVNFEDDVAGLTEVKATAQMLLALFDEDVRRDVERTYGEEFADRGGSMLLYGPPGCGKTHVSEAIAYEAKHNAGIEEQYGEVAFLEVRGSDIQSKYSGESEKNVKAVFDRAHEIARDGFAVLFFDEVETLIPDRSDDNLQRHERALTNAFLQEMNDVEDNLFVIGATNMPFTIDPAATRRFPIQQFIEQPGQEVMTEVWRKQLSSLPNADQVDFERLGEATVGYTPAEVADRILGADLQRELIQSVVEGNPQEVTTEYLIEKVEETEPKTVRQFVTSVREQVDELEGYPEMSRYVNEQAERLDIAVEGNGAQISDLLDVSDAASAASDAPGDGDDGPGAGDAPGDGDDGSDTGTGDAAPGGNPSPTDDDVGLTDEVESSDGESGGPPDLRDEGCTPRERDE